MNNVLLSLVSCSVVFLSGCATLKGTEVSTTEADIKIEGSTVDLFPADFDKYKSSDFFALKSVALKELSSKGMRPVNALQVKPDYLIMLDYASDLGPSFNYERRLLLAMYEYESGIKVQHIKYSWISENKPTAISFKNMVSEAAKKLPLKAGVNEVNISE